MKRTKERKHLRILLLSIFLTVLFYLFGMYFGMRIFEFFYANELRNKINFLYIQAKNLNDELNLNKEILLLEFLDRESKCKLLEKLIEKVRDYAFNVISKELPHRLEDYEYYHKPPEEYFELKKEYMKIMTTSYLLTLKFKRECNRDISTILYFYSSDCGEICIKQGEELDKLREFPIRFYFFIVDKNFNLSEVKVLSELYEVDQIPTIIIDEKVFLKGFSNSSLIYFHLKKSE